MPFPPKKKADEKPKADTSPEAADATPPAAGGADSPAPPPPDPPAADDPEGGGPIVDADEVPAGGGDEAAVGAAIAELTSILEPEGIMFHASASDSALMMLQHVITAFKTHVATKAGADADQPDPNKPDPNQPTQTPQNQEPEISESAPIMMSTATPTPREEMMAKKLLSKSVLGLAAKINAHHANGFIDEAIKNELTAELGAVKLSAADLDDNCDVRPCAVAIKLEMLDRLAKSGKAGSFAKPSKSGAPRSTPDPLKPISSVVTLSAAQEEVINPPGLEDGEPNFAAQEREGDDLANRTMSNQKPAA